jgi:RND family efflux transporter MFP subunit
VRRVALALCLLAGSARAGSDELECLITPKTSASLAMPIEGVVAKVYVDRGDFVKKGQVLAELETDVERAAVEIARAKVEMVSEIERSQVRLEFAQRAQDRNKELFNGNIVSNSQLDESQSTLDLARSGLKSAQEAQELAKLELRHAEAALEERLIKSPIDGVVVQRFLTAGEYAESRAILRVAEIDPLYVEVFAPVELLGKIAEGTTATVFPEVEGLGPFEAKVTIVDRVVEGASATFGVRLELPNPENHITAGLKCRVRFPGVKLGDSTAAARLPPPAP